jgi:hypothetical protein
MAEQDRLAKRCEEAAELARSALDWIGDPENADLVGQQHRSLRQEMRRNLRRAGKLARSARTRMSVSVFGPSQAGKSFLVSVLARPEGGRLTADFGAGGTLDYIREINPEGEGESTGLVTRFTMDRSPAPDGFPIRLTLLSEADIARTILNSFFMDGDQSEPPPEPADIAAQLDRFRGKAGSPVPGLTEDDVFEIAEYVETTFGRTAYGAALRGLWDEAAGLLPRLSPGDRAAFFGIAWGGHAPLGELYATLASALARLGHVPEVHTGLDALVPRDQSIIDVKTLHGLMSEDGGGTLKVCTPTGTVVDLPRAQVCALAAELVLPMQVAPSPLFAETDLLDFPGARNRFEQPLSKTLDTPEKSVPELLLRGKVAYLFDRYVANQEITSMLLCVPDSNMETLDLPGLVENWIGMTHGNRADLRTSTDCILFFVLTKFDKHLGESAADGGVATRFERRIQASLLEKFGRSRDNWVAEWTPGQPFRNCFWLRNPNFYVEGLIEYDRDMREVRLRPEKQDRLAELREGCLAADPVRNHFTDPEAAWDAALSLNDGGVSYLTAQLARVCRPDSKLRQIRSQLDRVLSELQMALQPFHVSDDVDERINAKKAAANEVIDGLEAALERHRFGAVMAGLMVDQHRIEESIGRVPSSVRITSAVAGAGNGSAAPASAAAPLARPGGLVRPGRTGSVATAPTAADSGNGGNGSATVRTRTLEQFQAETAMEAWIDQLTRFRDAARTRRSYGLSDQASADLVAELIHAARRTGLAARTAARLSEISFGLTVDRQARPAAILCAESINRFVTCLGMDKLAESDRPIVTLADGATRVVFAPRPRSDTADALPATPRPIAADYWVDWVFSLEAMFIANAKDGDNGEINIEQNLKLGRILQGLGGGAVQ